jgi:CBS domain-containing protein
LSSIEEDVMVQKVHEVMTRSPVTVDRQANLTDAARMMRDRDIGDLMVMDNGRLYGVLTDRDIVVRAAADARDLSSTVVDEVCSKDIVDIGANDDADQAVMLMRARAVRRIPVMDGGKLVGVVALSDMAVERDDRSALAGISTAQPNH